MGKSAAGVGLKVQRSKGKTGKKGSWHEEARWQRVPSHVWEELTAILPLSEI